MAIKVLKKISEKDACLELEEKSEILTIKAIGKIGQSKFGEDKYYFYITYEFEDGRTLKISYLFDKKEDYYSCTSRSKLFEILKGFLEINKYECNGVDFERDDLIELLLNKRFLATAEFREIYGNSFPYIIVLDVL